MSSNLIQRLAEKSITREELLRVVECEPEVIPVVVDGLASAKPAERYGCARVLTDLSARHPEWLYPHWDAFAHLLGGRYRPLTWSMLVIIANLAEVDSDGRLEGIFDRYYSLMGDGYLVTAANVVGNSTKIARAKPVLADRVAEKLLKVEAIKVGPHMTEECKRVLAEKAVEAFESLFELLGQEERERVIAFVKRQSGSSRKSLASAAERFLALRH